MTDAPEPAVKVTLTAIYEDQQDMKSEIQDLKRMLAERLPDRLHDRLGKLEAQVTAQWVVVGIVIVGLGGMLAKVLIGG